MPYFSVPVVQSVVAVSIGQVTEDLDGKVTVEDRSQETRETRDQCQDRTGRHHVTDHPDLHHCGPTPPGSLQHQHQQHNNL